MNFMRLAAGSFFLLVFIIGCATTGELGPPAGISDQARAYGHFLSSIVLERRGEFDEALREMEKVPSLDQEALTPTLRLVRAYLYRQDYERALEMCERAVDQQPDSANLLIVLGEIYHQLGRNEDAVAAFSRAIEVNPDNVLGYGALAELQESTNDLIAAIDIYQRLTELQPDSAPLHYQLGINLARIDNPEGAGTALARALELDPNLLRARYLLGVIYFEQGRFADAERELRTYLETRSDDPSGLETLAGALAQQEKWGEAFDLINAVLQSAQADPGTHLQAMYLKLRAGQPAEARALAPPEGAPFLGAFLRAAARLDLGEPVAPLVEGMATIEGSLDQEANDYLNEMLYLFGDAAGEYLLSKAAALQAAATRSLPLTIVQARTHMSMENYAKAVPLLETALARGEASADLHYYRAVCYESLDDFARAESALKDYLALEPDDPEVLNFLGYLYAEKGVKLDEAEALLLRALAADPDNPFYLDSLGWVYYKRGDGAKAVDLIGRAILGMDNDDAVLRDHLGDAYLLIGDVKRAIAEWERAHRLDPTLEGVADKIKAQRPQS